MIKKLIVLLVVVVTCICGAGVNDSIIHSFFNAVPLWTPYEITKAGWYDATDSSTLLLNGSAVTNWLDKSGNNLHLRQTITTNQPTTGSSINGLNALDFTDDAMTTATNPFAPAVSNAFVIVVHKVESVSAAQTFFTLTGTDLSTRRWQSHAPYSGGTLYFDCGNIFGANRVSAPYGVTVGDNVIVSFYCSIINNVQQVYKNGSLLVGDATGHIVSTSGNITVGSNLVEYQDTAIGEFIIIKGTVSVSTRQKLEGYLAHKWNLASNLPSNHPYKSSPPTL